MKISSISISEVAKRTGVNPITLRAWERRYGLLQPERTAKGHRLYSESDIMRINQILGLIEQGISVGQVAPLLEQAQDTSSAAITTATIRSNWQYYIDSMMSAIESYDYVQLDQLYNKALSIYPINLVTKKIIIPLLMLLGDRWGKLAPAIAEEHFFSVFLRSKIGARIHHELLYTHGKKLILACLPEEYHDFGLLLFALHTMRKGYYPIILGSNLPIEQLQYPLMKTNATGVVLKGKIDANRIEEVKLVTKKFTIPVMIKSTIDKIKRVDNNIFLIPSDFDQALKAVDSIIKKS